MTHLVNLNICYGPKSHPVEFDALSKVAMPDKTDSYTPIRHDNLVTMVKDRMAESGLNIVQESHVLWRNGQRYFGLMQVNHPDLNSTDSGLIVGLRNSLDKSLPATILSGDQVFLCDNLCFSAETNLARKHTTFILNDLPKLIGGAMQTLFKHWQKHLNRVTAYKDYDLGNIEAHDLIAQAYLHGAISKTQVADVINQWHRPNHNEFKGRNLWNLHNAFTETWKGRLDLLPTNSSRLHSDLDKLIEWSDYTENEIVPVSS